MKDPSSRLRAKGLRAHLLWSLVDARFRVNLPPDQSQENP